MSIGGGWGKPLYQAAPAAPYTSEERAMSWAVEIQTHDADLDSWFGNSFRFTHMGEADSYAINLQQRWPAVRRYRIVQATDLPNATYLNGVIAFLSERDPHHE